MQKKEFEESTHKKTLKLETYMEKQRVEHQIYLEQSKRSAPETILKAAEEVSADIIAVAVKANKLEAFLGGSTTRQILRESELPTLVLKV